MDEFGSAGSKVGGGALLLGMGVLVGIGLFYAYAPSERKRRQRVADAVDNYRKVRESCRRRVEEARENITAVRRGDVGTSRSRRSGSEWQMDTDPDELEGWY